MTKSKTTPATPDTFSGFADPRSKLGPGDIVIIGAGLAGLYTALKLAPLPVTIIAAAPLGEGASSAWAQGGVAAAVGLGDTPGAHARDTVIAGAGTVDTAVAQLVAAEAGDRVRDLLSYGVPFDRNSAGDFVLSKEAAHSANRIVRVSGDRAGAAIMQALITAARNTPSIRVLTGYEAEDLIVDDGRVRGVRLIRGQTRGTGSYELIPASAVVLATGGVGGLFAVTTNPAYARGEAIAFAARAGAVIADPEFVQFHPTAIDIGADPAPLATEALRGEGAILINRAGDRFMRALHADAELAPRDVVARGVFAEVAARRGAFLDCRDAIGQRFAEAYPTVFAHCQNAGIDPVTQLIPVAPAAHYHMGGVATDVYGRTTVEGLWAAGEVASTGLHGANRLASNSLLEAVVFGARVAADVGTLVSRRRAEPVAELRLVTGGKPMDTRHRADALAHLRRTMSQDVGVVRDARGLKRALSAIADIAADVRTDGMLTNMTLAARFIAAAALQRKESRGGHFRSDFPNAIEGRAKRTFMTLDQLKASERSARRTRGDAVAPRVAELAL